MSEILQLHIGKKSFTKTFSGDFRHVYPLRKFKKFVDSCIELPFLFKICKYKVLGGIEVMGFQSKAYQVVSRMSSAL